MINTTSMVSPLSAHQQQQHASIISKKPCTSASCCSPSRLWKQIQTIINTDSREEFRKLTDSTTKLPHVVNVLLTSRLSNNPILYYNKPIIQIDRRLIDKFGKSLSSATDLNALEIALLQRHDYIAYHIIMTLKRNTSIEQMKQFLNHQFNNGFTSLHLACFWGMSKLVRLLLEEGANPFGSNKRQLRPIDCTTHKEIIAILKEKEEEEKMSVTTTTTTTATRVNSGSLLLKKAEKSIIQQQHMDNNMILIHGMTTDDKTSITPIMSPLSFSSSSSSSSSFSSLSSFEYQWTPPTSPIPPSSFTSRNNDIMVEEEEEVEEQLKKLQIVTATIEEQEQDEKICPIIEKRSGCFPRISSISSSSIIDNNKQSIIVLQQKPKKKVVQFNSQIILMDACIRGDKEEIIEIMNQQEEINFNEIRDIQNRSLLHLALMHGQENLVEFLHDKIDINHVDNDGKS
jgi:ankyrin repeat protein